ncbi:MAG TPA: enoyl-CoA hydratase-related protein [Actinomycetota bacterium]|nr:enoyl-CoA hydratase-related protein [Actinomycetota bacterium]
MGDSVRLEVDDAVGIVRLDRPPANAIDLQLATELNDAIREAADRDEVGSLVLWGGERIFAAGADIKAMAEWGPDEVRPTVDALGAASDLLAEIPKVSIAAVNGFALGGGLELALGADLRFLADDATVGQPEITLGVIPGAGGTQRLTQMIGPSGARDLVYSGRLVRADEARRLGIADRVVPAADVLPTAVEAARAFARGPRQALAAAKAAIGAALVSSGPEGIARERRLFLDLFGTADQREGMRAFLEKRDPRFGA